MEKMTRTLLIFVCCCVMVAPVWSQYYNTDSKLTLTFSMAPTVIKPIETRNMTLTCTGDPYQQVQRYRGRSYQFENQLTYQVARIRILKKHMSDWQTIAQISDLNPESVQILDSSISFASGLVRNDTTAVFLKIVWNIATLDAYGQYRCDAIAFPANKQSQTVAAVYRDLTIGNDLNALNMLMLMTHENDKITERLENYNKQASEDRQAAQDFRLNMNVTQKELAAEVSRLNQVVENQNRVMQERQDQLNMTIELLEGQQKKRMDELMAKIQLTIDSGFLMLWPPGSYGLLMPDTGCPEGGAVNWTNGWRRHHTESTDRNRDKVSEGNHLYGTPLSRQSSNNFITQHFCLKTESNTVGPAWPAGSYCINKKGRCPDPFQEGFIRWDEENDKPSGDFKYELPDGFFDGNKTIIYYCCRRDGSVDNPVYLPNALPFYLYRYGGHCQQVYGMNVTDEYLEFDTENDDNQDAVGNIHPDGSIDNVRLQLCYYQKY